MKLITDNGAQIILSSLSVSCWCRYYRRAMSVDLRLELSYGSIIVNGNEGEFEDLSFVPLK